jgi:uncharacterized protein (DUF4415 family)
MSPEERRKIETSMAALPEPDLTDPDNPEWTEETFARAVHVDDLQPELQAATLAAFPRTKLRGKQKAPTKAQVTLRLDRDILDHFRATGMGWQSRINAALREIVGEKRA